MAINPFQQLDVLKKALQKGKQITDCYRLMYNSDLWIKAHKQLYDLKTLNEVHIQEVDEIILKLKKGTFRFENHRDRLQPPSYRELMVLEVIKVILTTIFKETHLNKDVLNQSLKEVKRNWNDQTWLIYGGINQKKTSDWYHLLLKNIENKVSDRRFLLLLHHAIFSGIIDKTTSNKGATLISILYSIYFQEVDLFLRLKLNKGKKANTSIGTFKYIQEFDHFLMTFKGSKDEAVHAFNEIQLFFSSKLLYANKEYSLYLSNLKKPVLVCGYEMKRCKQTNTLLFKIPDVTLKRLSKKYGEIEGFLPMPRPGLINLSERKIMRIYHAELSKFVLDYRGANNWHDFSKLFSLARGSYIRTIAMKRKCSINKVSLEMKSYKQGDLCIKVKAEGEVESLYPFIKLSEFSFLRY
ncbi:Group II intron-encoded protein ltrA [Mycobacteroides abscessus subsp. abscessus]|nr:Group II intron-encoded protein ltrA [Mycobacteroides abscessus subsp. abscessus]